MYISIKVWKTFSALALIKNILVFSYNFFLVMILSSNILPFTKPCRLEKIVSSILHTLKRHFCGFLCNLLLIYRPDFRSFLLLSNHLYQQKVQHSNTQQIYYNLRLKNFEKNPGKKILEFLFVLFSCIFILLPQEEAQFLYVER